jgi:hypothetical protein
MRLQVVYECSIKVLRFEQKYEGWLEIALLNNNVQLPSVKFWFMLHFPYEKDLAEMAFYTDNDKLNPFAEGVAIEISGTHPGTGKSRLKYHFADVPKGRIGVVSVITNILSFVVLNIESEIEEVRNLTGITVELNYAWDQLYDGPNESIATSFIDFMKKS